MTKAPGSASPQSVTTDRPVAGARRAQKSSKQDSTKQAGEALADQLLRATFARASQVFGQAVSIFMQTPQHRHLPLSDLEWWVIPPTALLHSDFPLCPLNWKCAERAWFVDVVAPPLQRLALMDSAVADLSENWEAKVSSGELVRGRRVGVVA